MGTLHNSAAQPTPTCASSLQMWHHLRGNTQAFNSIRSIAEKYCYNKEIIDFLTFCSKFISAGNGSFNDSKQSFNLLFNNFIRLSILIIRKYENRGQCLLRTRLLDMEIKNERLFSIKWIKLKSQIGRTESRKIGVALDTRSQEPQWPNT